ncbi:MAG: gamma-glutamylcyclotransferase family protein [Candidatus Binatia bacterium]
MVRGRSLRVFVYGTLRRGARYHDRFCAGALSIVEGTVRGRLGRLPAGYPVIDVAAEAILACGSGDPEADADRLAELDALLPGVETPPADPRWEEIAGELVTFDDPAERLPALDALEGFRPGVPSLYDRVALAVRTGGGKPVVAWVYVRGDRARV